MSDLTIIWLFILTPLVIFLVAYVVETYLSFKRLISPRNGRDYLDATWEITHTFLVVSVALFVGFFSNNLVTIAHTTFFPLFFTSIFIGIRTLAYIYIFVISSAKKQQQRTWIDMVFAWSHIGVIAGLLYLLAVLIPQLLTTELIPNTSFIAWMVPGAVIIFIACLAPLISLYRIKK